MPTIHLRYLNHHISRQLNELYVSTVIFSFATSMLLIYIPIYLYELGFSLEKVILYFLFHYVAYAVFMLGTGKIIAKIGYEPSIGISIPIYTLFLLTLFLIPTYSSFFYISSFLWAFCKAFYWPAFHADFAQFGNSKAIGEEISSLKVLIGLVSILGPTIGGFLLAFTGFKVVFAITIVLAFASLVPLLISKEKYVPQRFEPKRILKYFIRKKYRNDVIANLGTGEDIIAQSVWPIFLFTIFANYKDIGIITTIALFIAFVVILIMGKLANRPKRAGLIKATSAILSLSWFARILSFNWLSIFVSDALYKTSKRTLQVPVQALIYSRKKKNKLLNYIVFREIALCLGKVLLAFIAYLVIVISGQIFLTFVVAGLFALFYFYWTDQLIDDTKGKKITPPPTVNQISK